METENLQNEIKAFREVLQKGRLTEIDLDALSDCLEEAGGKLTSLHVTASELRIMKDDLVGEIVRFVRASKALKDGVAGVDSETLSCNVEKFDAAQLIAIRNKMRAAFSNLQREGDFPRRCAGQAKSERAIEDYRIDNARV